MSLNTTTLDDNVHEDMRTGVVMLDLFCIFCALTYFLGPVAAVERLRIQRRATRYKHSPADENQTQGPLSKDRLLRKLENGSTMVVPPTPT